MYTKPKTLTEFIVEEGTHLQARGNFTLLLTHIENAGKIIASHVKRAGLVDIMGKTGGKNASNDEVKKIDILSNDIFIATLQASKQVYAYSSEESEKTIILNEDGEYTVFFDPLDGSANIENNMPLGTIFSIYHRSDTVLRPGKEQVAAGYILYSTSVMFVYTTGKGVNGFTLDPSLGSFLLSHPHMTMPDKGDAYATNEGRIADFPKAVQAYLTQAKTSLGNARYIGAAVADTHRMLINGGIFLYPEDIHTKESKHRLMYEVNPLAFLVEQAGGKAISTTQSPLEIIPKHVHQKAAIIMGSKNDFAEYMRFAEENF